MAMIYNTAMDRYVRIHLYEDSRSREWIKYTLDYGVMEKGECRAVDRLCDSELYFDAYIDPEIPGLTEGLHGLLTKRIQKLVFRPVDEGDFVLAIEATEAQVFSMVLSSDRFEHKIRHLVEHSLFVSGEEIGRFAEQLSEEYRALRSIVDL